MLPFLEIAFIRYIVKPWEVKPLRAPARGILVRIEALSIILSPPIGIPV
jgi:hypothetical protein